MVIFCLSGCENTQHKSFDTNNEFSPSFEEIEKTEKENNSLSSALSAKINLNEYLSVEYNGRNLGGHAILSFDKEAFLLDNIKKVSFNKKNKDVFFEIYGSTDSPAAALMLNYISADLDKNRELSNGDVITAVWTIDTNMLETYFKCDYVYTPQTFTVTGLLEADSFDPFENLEINYYGYSPYGSANVHNAGTLYGGSYSISPNGTLSNGDQITVIYSCEDKSTMIANYGTYPSSFEKTYIVSGLTSYVQSMSEVSIDNYNKLISDAASQMWIVGTGIDPNAKCIGNYFFSAKNEPAHGVQFLRWCGTPVGNAVCFVFEYQADIWLADEERYVLKPAYLVIALENLLIDESGNLIYNKQDMWQMHDKYSSKEALEQTYVGVFDEIMVCSSNVSFG